MRSLLFLLLLCSTLLSAKEITIAVAANVSYAIDEIKAAFIKSHAGTQVRVIVGGSGKLAAQIQSGAPFGLFMSADMGFPTALYEANLSVKRPEVYAEGALVCFSMRPKELSSSLKTLSASEIKRIAIANPKTAPYGKAAVAALKNAEVYDEVQAKLVYGESISQTLSYAMTAADVGIISKSALYTPMMKEYKEHVHWEDVDRSLYHPIKQGILLLKVMENEAEYRAFYDFILSDEGAQIFKRYGYLVP